MTELTRLELLPSWTLATGAAGNTGQTGAVAVSTRKVIADLCDLITIAPDPANPTAYQNSYWYLTEGPQDVATHTEYEYDLWIDAPFASAPQGIEFEQPQRIDSLSFDPAIQLDYVDKLVRYWNGSAWVSTGQAFAGLIPAQWHHFKLVGDRTPDMLVHYTDFEIDGQAIIIPASPVVIAKQQGGKPDILNIAFQLDLNPSNGAYQVYRKNVTFRYS